MSGLEHCTLNLKLFSRYKHIQVIIGHTRTKVNNKDTITTFVISNYKNKEAATRGVL